MSLWQSICGQIRVRLISADVPGALNAMEQSGIHLSNVTGGNDLSIDFTLARNDLHLLQELTCRRGEELEILNHLGLYWTFRELLGHPVMVAGVALLLWLSIWAPGRIFFLFVEGNDSVPTNLILEQAQLCGMEFGASRRDVRSEQVKNRLLQQIPQLQWAGVNTYGCVAIISVTEGNTQQQHPQNEGIYRMEATMDGVIRQITVTGGQAMCTPGQAVIAGQTLISGYTDCGICIRADSADGEVFADTRRNLTAVFPMQYTTRGKILSETKKYSLIIGKKRINFQNNSGISSGECVRIYSENYITLPGGFLLPVAIATERYVYYETQLQSYEAPEAVLQPFMEEYLLSRMIAGCIVSRWETLVTTEDVAILEGIYGCYEMIGILRPEECLPEYENSGTNRQCRTGGRPDGRVWFL